MLTLKQRRRRIGLGVLLLVAFLCAAVLTDWSAGVAPPPPPFVKQVTFRSLKQSFDEQDKKDRAAEAQAHVSTTAAVKMEAPAVRRPAPLSANDSSAVFDDPSAAPVECRDISPVDRTTAAALRTDAAVSQRWYPKMSRDKGGQPINGVPLVPAPMSLPPAPETPWRVDPAGVECYGPSGRPTPAPWFAAPLLQAMGSEERYRAVARYVNARYFVSLVGFDEFTAKHIAPDFHTRPAHWSAKLVGEGERRATFRLTTRAAHGDCIVQYPPPLHIHGLRCSAAPGLPSVLLHQCVHNVDPWPETPNTSVTTTAQAEYPAALRGHLPALLPRCLFASSLARRPPLPAVPASALKPREGSNVTLARRFPGGRLGGQRCFAALAVPWLVPRTVVPVFPYEGRTDDLAWLLRRQADPDTKAVVMTMLDENYIDHLYNFAFSLEHRGGRGANLIIATLTPGALIVCQLLRLACYDARPLTLYGDAGTKGNKVAVDAGFIKPRLTQAVIELGYRFSMFDLDMTIMGDPMPGLLHPAVDLVYQADHGHVDALNSGILMVEPSLRAWLVEDNTMIMPPSQRWNDQDALAQSMHFEHTSGVSRSRRGLLPYHYADQCSYIYPWGDVKHPPHDDQGRFGGTVLHAACVAGGPKIKEGYMRAVGTWLVNELDFLVEEGPVCIVAPDGTAVRDVRGIMPHTRGYGEFDAVQRDKVMFAVNFTNFKPRSHWWTRTPKARF